MKIGCRFRDPDLYCVLSAPDVSTLAHLFPEETPSLVKELDVSVLHEVVLGRLLGLSREQQSRQEYLAYAKGEALALEMLDGEKQDLCAAFLLNPAPVSQIMKIAFEGILLPQKTTYFFPKVMTGLVFSGHACIDTPIRPRPRPRSRRGTPRASTCRAAAHDSLQESGRTPP